MIRNTSFVRPFTLVLALTFTSIAYAQDASRQAAAERYIRAVPMSMMLEDAISELSKQVPPEKRAQFISDMRATAKTSALEQIAKVAMVKIFSTDELNALADFYATEHGASTLRKFGAYMGEIMPPVMQEIQRIVQEIQANNQRIQSGNTALPRSTINGVAGRSNILIGHVGPTSGVIGHLGKENENGARLAIDEVNASGVLIDGEKVFFELVAEDDAADPRLAIVAAQKLAGLHVSGVVGHLNSGTSISASKIYSDAGIPQISPSAPNPKYTRQDLLTTFRLVADDAQLATTLGRFAIKSLHADSIAVIDDHTSYGRGLVDAFSLAVEAAGGKVVANESTTDTATDFKSILTTIKNKNPDVVFFGGRESVAGPMLQQMKSLGLKAKFMGGDGICSPELVKFGGDAIADGQVFCAEAGGVEGKDKAGLEEFRNKYKAKFGRDFQIYAPYTFDAVKVMIAAMVDAKSSDPAKYLPVLARTTDYKGVTGRITFDRKGDIKNGALTMKTFRGGKLETLVVIR
jgi:branched-chain amino acid transport system substrate-binding protein